MADWSSYTLSDFLLFSSRVYERLFELHNAVVWPAQLVMFAIGLVIAVLVLRPIGPVGCRWICGLLGAIWLFVSWSFFWERYATINWAANYVAPFVALEGLLLLFMALFARPPVIFFCHSPGSYLVLMIFGFALLGYPLIAAAMGRPVQSAEVFGIAPDPTAVATLGVLALGRGPLILFASVVPCLWCMATGLTLLALGWPDWFIAPLLAVAALLARLLRGGREKSAA